MGDSTEASRCENSTISFSSVASAASTAASEVGRPTDNGISRYGNKHRVLQRQNRQRLDVVDYLTFEFPSITHTDQQNAIARFQRDAGMLQVTGISMVRSKRLYEISIE